MLVRKLVPADLGAYRALRIEVIESFPTAFASSVPEEIAASDDRFMADIAPRGRGCVVGAFDGEALIGVAGLRTEEKKQVAHKGLLFGMAVRPRSHRQGVGRTLLQALLAEAQKLGLRQLVLTYSQGNASAARLYSSCGFTEFGREPRAVIVAGIDIVRVYMFRLL